MRLSAKFQEEDRIKFERERENRRTNLKNMFEIIEKLNYH